MLAFETPNLLLPPPYNLEFPIPPEKWVWIFPGATQWTISMMTGITGILYHLFLHFFLHWQRKEQTITFEGLPKWFCLLNLSLFLLNLFSFSQENVLLGSDYPFPLGEPHPGKLIEDVYKENVELRVSTHGTVMHPVNEEACLTRYLLAEFFAFMSQSPH